MADFKYQPALERMGVHHGSQFDCGKSECLRCKPFRIIEKQQWDSLTEEEQHEVKFYRFGL